jgi:hypothetical protein
MILCILSDYNVLKLEINNKNSSKKHTIESWTTHYSMINGSLMK